MRIPHDGLNYHHLRYFWAVAGEGSVTRASQKLEISQPTVSAQLKELESALGEPLFERQGRRLVLTEAGRIVHRYADEIFSLGQELLDTLEGRPSERPVRLRVGVANAVPKLVTFRLLERTRLLPVQLECSEARAERLVADLAIHDLDLVISDAPAPPGVEVRAFSHLLGESGVSVFGGAELVERYRSGFPASLDGAPMLLPTRQTSLRQSLDSWLQAASVRPRIVAEFEDTSLLKVFGESGAGLFPIPSAVDADVARRYDVKRLGRLEGLRERFYLISLERRLRHPAMVTIKEVARALLSDNA